MHRPQPPVAETRPTPVATRLRTLGGRVRDKVPVISGALGIARRVALVDRAAALALFCMFAAVPALLGAFSALGFFFEKVHAVAEVAGYHVRGEPIIARMTEFVHNALPGVTWDPTQLAETLVRHRTYNGVFGVLFALILGLAVFSRIDAAIRAIFRRPQRSAWRAAGLMSVVFLVMMLLALLLSLATPLSEWGLYVAHSAAASVSGMDLWMQWLPLVVSATETLPIAVGFYVMVRWSAGTGTIGKRRLLAVATGYALIWFVGRRAFSLYVSEIIAMDAIYGALTGIVALMLWLYYATLGFLFTVALLASWERVRLRMNGDTVTP